MKCKFCLEIVLLLTMSSWGQTIITEKDLLGKWQISTMEVSGILIDYDRKQITLPEELKALRTDEDMENMKKDAFSEMGNKGFYGLEFTTGSRVSFVNGDNRKERVYTLQDEDGKQLFEGGPVSAPGEISIRDGKLQLRYQTDGLMVMTLKKVK